MDLGVLLLPLPTLTLLADVVPIPAGAVAPAPFLSPVLFSVADLTLFAVPILSDVPALFL